MAIVQWVFWDLRLTVIHVPKRLSIMWGFTMKDEDVNKKIGEKWGVKLQDSRGFPGVSWREYWLNHAFFHG